MTTSNRVRYPKLKLTDVAARVGVSTSTVSRTLTRPDLVRESVRLRVQKAIEELGYRPHAAARALAASRSRNIGVIVPTLDFASFAAGVGALEARLSQANYMLQLTISNFSSHHEFACARELLARGVDGIVMIGVRHSQELYNLIDDRNLPFVNIWDFVQSDTRPCIGFDNRQAGYHIANYVVDEGHQRIAIIAGGGPQRSDRSIARLEGVLSAMSERGLVAPPEMIIEVPYLPQAGSAALQQLLKLNPWPSAVICTNDVLAVGAMLECQRLGISVPDQMSFSGFDDIDIGALMSPGLTTVSIPTRQMGHLAAEYLIEKIEGRDPLTRIKLDYALVVRGSVRRSGRLT